MLPSKFSAGVAAGGDTMKLATLRDGSRDGQLLVVSHDLSLAHPTNGIVSRLRDALDDWEFIAPQLRDLYTTLNHGKARHAFAFDPARCMAPLPRCFQRLEARAYPGHDRRVQQAAAQDKPLSDPPEAGTPVLRQASGEGLLGACDDVVWPDEAVDLDAELGLAVLVGDVERGSPPSDAQDAVRLLVLKADWCARRWQTDDPARAWPWTSCAPVAVTPDALDGAWRGGRVLLSLNSRWNEQALGQCDLRPGMAFSWGQVLAHAASVRGLRAGTWVGAGPVSDPDTAHGAGSLAESRALEQLAGGPAQRRWGRWGDRLHAEVIGRDGHSVFGALAVNLSDA